MCGICGQYNFKNQNPVNPEIIKMMTRTLVHRGPDDEGFYVSGSLGLGFRRLSIIDLKSGQQPMSDQDKLVWVVFNGEIYNFLELRRELEGYGHVFRTKSDTEVIVHGYKQWGEKVLEHLNGMFGIAIWDEKNKKLMIARDRMGIKLVYYKIESGCLYFGSEIRPLLACDKKKPEIDLVAANLFLRYRYTPSPYTLFKGIRKLAPGTKLVIKSDKVRSERWWIFKPSPFDPMPSFDQATMDLLELYKKSVQRHLISDVPVGLLLSGGLDSGLLLALMNQNGNLRKTFTVGFGQSFCDDELYDAARTAKILRSPNISVEINREVFETNLSRIVSIIEEPIASESIVSMYFVCERASQDVKVVLMGQGPDELLGGYRRHLGVHYGSYWRALPNWCQNSLKAVLNLLPRNESIERGLYSLGVTEKIKRYQQIFSILPGSLIDSLFRDNILPPDTGDRILECWEDLVPLMEETDELGGFQFLEIRSSLPDELLMYADKLSMAHGLEVRVPYLDQEIVEYVERLSASFKIRFGSRKWLHRRICREYLPHEIIKRKKKGFDANITDDWFRYSLSKKFDNILLDPGCLMYKYLRPEIIRKLVKEHQKGFRDNHKILFSLVVLEEWLRCNFLFCY